MNSPSKKSILLFSKKGMSLIEMISAMAVAAIALPALAYLFNIAFLSSSENIKKTQAYFLANGLMNVISERRFKESAVKAGNGPDSGEVSQYDRRLFNDIDDYHQFKLVWGELSPPRDESGNAMNNFSEFTQYVEVNNVAAPSLGFGNRSFASVLAGSTDFKLVMVTIKSSKSKESVSIYKIFAAPL